MRLSLPLLVAATIAIGAFGIALGLTGWKQTLPDINYLVSYDAARAFLESGRIPEKSNVTSHGFYAPPGMSWLFVIGVAAFDHPVLQEALPNALLYVATLAALLLLARPHVGDACALLAVALFAFSKTGLLFARAGLGYGHPLFYVLSVYFSWRWVHHRDAKWLAAGLFAWAVGVWVFPTIAPLLVLFPFLWWLYRPPVRWRPLVVAALAGLVVWWPYLAFDMGNGFANTLSQITRASAIPDDFERTWRDPSLRRVFESQVQGLGLAGRDMEAPAGGAFESLRWWAIQAGQRVSVVDTALTANFQPDFGGRLVARSIELGSAAVLLVAVAFGLCPDLCRWLGASGSGASRRAAGLTFAGLLLAIAAVAANEHTLGNLVSRDGHLWPAEVATIQQVQAVLLASGLALVFRRRLGRWTRSLCERAGAVAEAPSFHDFMRFLAYALLVPLFVQFLLAPPGRDRYFHWLWPVECLFLSVFAVHVLPALARDLRLRWTRGAAAALLVAAICGQPLSSKPAFWMARSYAGTPLPLVDALAHVARTLEAEGRASASIGYHIPFAGYEVAFNVVDRHYKVGAVGDFLLRSLYGVVNENTAAEGVLPDDEFRIVAPPPPPGEPVLYVPPPGMGFREQAVFGGYAVMRRETHAAPEGKRRNEGPNRCFATATGPESPFPCAVPDLAGRAERDPTWAVLDAPMATTGSDARPARSFSPFPVGAPGDASCRGSG